MTSADYDDFDDYEGSGTSELFETRAHQDHLLIVKIWDEIAPVVTERCPTGYVTRNGREWPNNALRAAVVDLDLDADDGTRGRVYPTAMILTGLLIKELKSKVGRTLLLIWRQDDPADKSSPYQVWNMKADPAAVEAGRAWLAGHPEFKTLAPPPPWTTAEPRDNGRTGRQGDPRSDYDRDDRPRYEDHGRSDNRGRNRSEDRREAPRRDGARDYGQHDDRPPRYEDRGSRPAPRRDGYSDDPWARQDRPQGRDGSFLDRSAESSRGGYQDDTPPF